MKAAVRTKPRASAGKKRWRGRDAHERQAEAGAAGFIRGQHLLGHALTAAPVAGYRVPGSVATFLPRPLAGELATAFGADLGGLRIHRDAPANDAARSLGARAFTSGSAIYFAERAWDPNSARGRLLIAHEVAHAIQQTGRAAHGGLRLEPGAVGEAGVQRDPVNDAVEAAKDNLTDDEETSRLFAGLGLLNPKTGTDACLTVLDRHLQLLPENKAVKEQIAKLREALAKKPDDQAVAAVQNILDAIPKDARSRPVIALFYDCFKAAGDGKRAVDFAGGKIPDRTAFGSWSFLEDHRRKDGKWAVSVLRGNKALAPYLSDAAVAWAKLEFYSLLSNPLDLDPEGKFGEMLRDAIAKALSYEPLMADERTIAALRALARFDAIRQQTIRRTAKEVAFDKKATVSNILMDRAYRRFDLVKSFLKSDHLAAIAKKSGAETEIVAIASAFGEAIKIVAKDAGRFWDDAWTVALSFRDLAGDNGNLWSRAQELGFWLAKSMSALPEAKDIQAKLRGILARVTQVEDGGLPQSSTLAANRATAAKQVAAIAEQVHDLFFKREPTLTKVVTVAAKIDPTIKSPGADAIMGQTAVGILEMLLFGLQQSLAYDIDSFAGITTNSDDPQYRLAEAYVATANRFRLLAIVCGFGQLANAALDAQAMHQPNWTRSYIGLSAGFREKPAPRSQFLEDLGGIDKINIRGADLAAIVQALYDETLLLTLEETLAAPAGTDTREFNYDRKSDAIINVAAEAAKQKSRNGVPRRYVVPSENVIIFKAAKDSANLTQILDRENLAPYNNVLGQWGPNDIIVVPNDLDIHTKGLTAWVLPGIDRIARKLADVPIIVNLTDGKGKALGPLSQYRHAYDWLVRLGEIAANREDLRKAITAALAQWQTRAHNALDAPFRRATSNLRRTVGPEIRKQWADVDASVHSKGYYTAPKETLRLLLLFMAGIRPIKPDEQELQKTALMLELAPELYDKLHRTKRFEIIFSLNRAVKNAAAFALRQDKADIIAALNLDFDPADIGARAETLSSLAEAWQDTVQSESGERKLGGDPKAKTLFIPLSSSPLTDTLVGALVPSSLTPPSSPYLPPSRPYPLRAQRNEDDNADDIVKDPNKSDPLSRKPIFYRLLDVYESFIFVPPVNPDSFERDGIGAGELDVKGYGDPKGVKLCKVMIMSGDQKPVEVIVKADKEGLSLLYDIYYALDFKITNEVMQDVGDVLEVVADVLITAIQILFPEFAPEIAYAQLASSIVQFFGGGEYQIVKALLSGDLGRAFSLGVDKLEAELNPEAFWDYLLFKDQALPDGLNALSTVLHGLVDFSGPISSVNRRKDSNTGSAIKTVFTGLATFASGLLDGVKTVHQHVAPPVRQAELFIQGEPYLAALLHFVVNHIDDLAHGSIGDIAGAKADDLLGNVRDMFGEVLNFILELGNFELPYELVPMPDIVRMVANFVIDRLPPKYRLVLRGAQKIDAVNKIFTWIYDKVAAELTDNGIDPNILWRKVAREALNPVVKNVGQEIADALRDVLIEVPFLASFGRVTVKERKDVFTGDVEAQPSVASGRTTPSGPARLPANDGEELPDDEREKAQRGMGHDFGHVRIHRGKPVDTALRDAGAEAATAGSHVYLDSRIDLSGPDGRDTLNHELAHVLQQGGARPLGERHSDRPASPQDGMGWRVDAGAEAQADGLAHAAREPASAPREVSAQYGVQPKASILRGVVKDFFSKAADAQLLEDAAKGITDTKVNDTVLRQAAPGLQENLADKLIEAFEHVQQRSTVKAPFDLAATEIAQYVLDNHKTAIRNDMPKVIASALKLVNKKDEKDKKKKKVSVLLPNLLKTRLEEYLFATYGLSIGVDLHETPKKEGPDQRERQGVNADSPFTKLTLRYVHFPMMGPSAKVWLDLIDRSFKDMKNGAIEEPATKARLVLAKLQAAPGLFAKHNRYRPARRYKPSLVLSDLVIEEIKKYSERLPKDLKISGDDAPTWQNYLSTKAITDKLSDKHGQIGLRLGLHQELSTKDKAKGGLGGRQRESHHTVQYLVLEYLNNAKSTDKQPFLANKDLYRSVEIEGGTVKTIRSKPVGGSEIHIGKNMKPGRAGPMPALLLSAFAHGANVHISPERDDDEEKDKLSQGTAVDNIFTDELGPYAKVVKDAKLLKALKNNSNLSVAGLPAKASEEGLARAIFKAAVNTYEEVRSQMNDKLAIVLNHEERAYYETLVATATNSNIYDTSAGKPTSAYTVKGNVSAEIMPKVKAQQKAILENVFGFKAVSGG